VACAFLEAPADLEAVLNDLEQELSPQP
jgi:hypothetical protein